MSKLKALPLALLAVFAMAAVVSASAQAADHLQCGVANPGSETCEIKITQHPQNPGMTQVFTTALGAVECTTFNATYKGAATLSSNSTLEGVKYGECEFAGISAEVDFHTCDYTLTSPIETVEGHGRGSVILGPANCEVKIIAGSTAEPLCTITVKGSQTFTNAITYTDVETAGKKEVTGHANANGIKYSFAGPICGEGTLEGGTYVGTFTAKAFTTGGTQVNLNTATT